MENREFDRQEHSMGGQPDGPYTVSYTHLDVYKRQVTKEGKTHMC